MYQASVPERRLLIDGEWLPAGERDRLEVRDPATGDVLGDLPVATPDDVAAAIAAASRCSLDGAPARQSSVLPSCTEPLR